MQLLNNNKFVMQFKQWQQQQQQRLQNLNQLLVKNEHTLTQMPLRINLTWIGLFLLYNKEGNNSLLLPLS